MSFHLDFMASMTSEMGIQVKRDTASKDTKKKSFSLMTRSLSLLTSLKEFLILIVSSETLDNILTNNINNL